MGLPHAIAVTTADVTDRDGAIQMILLNLDSLSCVKKFLVDGGYSGERFANQIKEICGAQSMHFGVLILGGMKTA